MLETGAQPLKDLIASLHTKLLVAELERQPRMKYGVRAASSRCLLGIGRATARRLDAAGWKVFAGVRREEDATALAAASARLEPLLARRARPRRDRRRGGRIEAEPGGLDGLVPNAGVAFAGPLETCRSTSSASSWS